MELSSKIKAMKFMKRKEDAQERKKQEAQQRDLAEQTHWRIAAPTTAAALNSGGLKFRVEYDTGIQSNTLYTGRHSFKQFNPETEKLNEEEKRKILKSQTGDDNKSISDSEMATLLTRRLSEKRARE